MINMQQDKDEKIIEKLLKYVKKRIKPQILINQPYPSRTVKKVLYYLYRAGEEGMSLSDLSRYLRTSRSNFCSQLKTLWYEGAVDRQEESYHSIKYFFRDNDSTAAVLFYALQEFTLKGFVVNWDEERVYKRGVDVEKQD